MEVNTQASAAPDATQGDSQGSAAPAPQPTTTDIDGISEFTFQGQKLTPQGLAKIFNEHQTYSEKLKESEKISSYVDNLEIDLEKVAADPRLAEQFKSVYPKQFHALVDKLVGTNRPRASQEAAPNSLPKEVQDRIDALEAKLSEYDHQTHQARVAQSEAYLQKTVDPLFAKYPYADDPLVKDAVYARVDAMMNAGYKMNDTAWERVIKEAHEAIKKRADDIRQKEIKTQLEKGKQALDTGAGGAAPGQAPAKKARTFAEAEMEALRRIKGL